MTDLDKRLEEILEAVAETDMVGFNKAKKDLKSLIIELLEGLRFKTEQHQIVVGKVKSVDGGVATQDIKVIMRSDLDQLINQLKGIRND